MIVLPAFNEAANLSRLFTRIDEAMYEACLPYRIVLVDDGSKDATPQIALDAASNLPIDILRHTVNLGLGATIRDGLIRACSLANPADVVVTLDADNSHTPELILRMVRLVREGHDVVIASRYQPGSVVRGVSLGRRILSRTGSLFIQVMMPIRGVRDYTCGYRAYRADLLQRVFAESPAFIDQDGFQVMVDILLKLRHDRSLVFGEAPLILRYDLKLGESKMRVGRTILATLGLVLRRRLERHV